MGDMIFLCVSLALRTQENLFSRVYLMSSIFDWAAAQTAAFVALDILLSFRQIIFYPFFVLNQPLLCVFARLPDGLTRRGDINLLLLGDPGTAKSQLLKFVEKVAPVGVSIA